MSKEYYDIENCPFKKGDKIIWDSHFGYEIGIFMGEGVLFHSYEVLLTTGVMPGIVASYSKDEIYMYSEELSQELQKKYHYTKFK